MYPFFLALPYSLHMSGCWNRIQTLCLFRRLQSLLSLSLFFFFLSLNPPQQLLSIQIKGLAEDRQKAFSLSNMKSTLLWGVEPWVPALIPLQPNNNSQSAQPRQKRITSHCWLVAAGAHRSQVSHDSHFLPLRKKEQEGRKKSKEVSPSCLEVC